MLVPLTTGGRHPSSGRRGKEEIGGVHHRDRPVRRSPFREPPPRQTLDEGGRGAAFRVTLPGTRCCMHSVLRPSRVVLAAAPLSVWQAHRRATSRGVPRFRLRRLRRDRFLGRRGCGAPISLLTFSGRARTKRGTPNATPLRETRSV
jgi:hypothetical protein